MKTMNFENLSDSKFQKLSREEAQAVKGGDRLWHTFITGRTKEQGGTIPEGCFQRDRMVTVQDPVTGNNVRVEQTFGDVTCR